MVDKQTSAKMVVTCEFAVEAFFLASSGHSWQMVRRRGKRETSASL